MCSYPYRSAPSQQTVAVWLPRQERLLMFRDVCADDNTNPTKCHLFPPETIDTPSNDQVRELCADNNTNHRRRFLLLPSEQMLVETPLLGDVFRSLPRYSWRSCMLCATSDFFLRVQCQPNQPSSFFPPVTENITGHVDFRGLRLLDRRRRVDWEQ